PHVSQRTDRLIEHDGHRGDFGHAGVGFPVLCAARLLEQFYARRFQPSRKATRVPFGVGAIGIDPNRGATGNRLLDGSDALEISVRVLADLNLEGAKAVLEPPLDLRLDLPGGST